MPSTYTSSLRLTLPQTGDLTNTWGTTVNTGITELVDASVAGTTTISTWGGAGVAYTLSTNNGSADESRRMIIRATGAPGEAKNVICPPVSKLYFFRNDTTGGFALTLKTLSGTGVAVPAGQYRVLYCDGTDVVEAFNSLSALTLGTALATSSGGTGATSFTANNVLLGNGASPFQTVAPGTANNVLYSNGTTWVSGPLPSASAVASFSAGTTGLTPSTATTGAITLAGTLAVANGGTGVTTSTGSGSVVLSTSPTLTTPTLGDATATSVNKLAITAPATSATLAIADGKTLTASNTLTFAGTDSTTMTFPPASSNVGYLNIPINSQSAAYTLVAADAGKTIFHPSTDNSPRTFTIPSNASVPFPLGTAITFINRINTVTISITSDTMYLSSTGATGSRTLAVNGVATAIKITNTEWMISGNGLT